VLEPAEAIAIVVLHVSPVICYGIRGQASAETFGWFVWFFSWFFLENQNVGNELTKVGWADFAEGLFSAGYKAVLARADLSSDTQLRDAGCGVGMAGRFGSMSASRDIKANDD
jgi:hypothetical protein